MSIFKCKMCGGTLEINANQTTAVCEYCGTQQTLPKLDDDRRANLYDRANHFRRNNEFDKAMSIYENILSEDGTDAEAYWSLVLCRYGIEYVEDPATHKRVPTVNRAQFTSIFDDDNYKSALENADRNQRSIYEAEAKAINEIQKGILAISQKEEPFDVFICYKETDHNGRRTQDSVLANDLYHQLTAEGFKVFFSRITLEDKLGVAYEPYIFAALNSAKVMVVLGTKPEYFNAVWVKNEWSRYLALVKQSAGKKILIPAYKDMDPYDLPEEFSHLQAQDMSKLGFMQDLIRGIKKLTQVEAPKATVKETVVVNSGNANVAPLLKRAFMYLEDGEWASADEYCEKVLDQDPENALAYLGKLMAELYVRKQDELQDRAEPFDDHNNYQKTLRFADDKLKTALTGYIEHINTRNENARLEGIYSSAKSKMTSAKTECEYKGAAALFETIRDYRDSANLVSECYEKAEVARKDAVLYDAKAKMTRTVISYYESAIKLFESISGWKDADEQIYNCKKKIEELKAKEEADRLERERKAEIARIEAEKRAKRNKKIAIITASVICVVIAFVIVRNFVIIPNEKYNDAVVLMEAGKYEEAFFAFEALNGYKDSEKKREHCWTVIMDGKYDAADALLKAGKYSDAISAFTALDGYKDSKTQIENCQAAILSGISDGLFCETVYEWTENADGSVTITGVAAGYRNYVTGKITLPEVLDGKQVTKLNEYVLYNCTGLTSVTIPDGVTSIGESAFHGCTGLTSVTIPDGVTSIGESAFHGCTGLTSITIPDSVTSIGGSTFWDCNRLTSITIPDNVTSIGDYAFGMCTGLSSITIPDGVTSIGEDAFHGCTGLTSITIPDSVTSIGRGTFWDCTGLTEIHYGGTKRQWKAVSKASSWNYTGSKYINNIYCTDGKY